MAVGFDDFDGFDGFDEGQAVIESEPLPGVAMPLDVEAIATNPVEAGERRIELFAEIVREAGTVTLDEAVLSAAPFAEDIDGVVELGRLDLGQEPGLREVGDQVFTRGADADLFSFGECGVWLRSRSRINDSG